MSIKRRITAFAVVIAMLFSMMPSLASAETVSTQKSSGTIAQAIVNNHKSEISNGEWVTVYSEATICGTESMVVKLFSDNELLGTTTLVDTENVLLNGNSNLVTYHFFLKGNDSWWKTDWIGENPIASKVPNKVELWVDDTKVGENTVSMSNSNDNLGADTENYKWGDLDGVKVAQIGNTYYEDFQEAINAATNGQTVKLLGDITGNKITVKDTQDVVIDLNQNTVTGYFMVKGKATIKNGTIINETNVSGIELNNNEEGASPDAEITLENLNVTSNRHAIRIDGGKATINSGKYVANDTATNVTEHAVNISTNANVVINGGTFVGCGPSSGGAAIATRGDNTLLVINNGEFMNVNNSEIGPYTIGAWGGVISVKGGIFHKAETDTLNLGGVNAPSGSGSSEFEGIQGGTFEDLNRDDTKLLYPGKAYKTVSGGDYDGWYEVVNAVANVEGLGGFATLDEAVKATVNNGTITLLADLADQVIEIGDKNLTLDLGSFTLAGEITVAEGKSLTIKGTSEGNSIELITNLVVENGYSLTWGEGNSNPITTADATGKVYKPTQVINQYTITFNTDGGSTVDAITQDYKTEVAVPTNPTKTGYTFTGWDKEIPTTMPAENMTITAQWTTNTYTVEFVGGEDVTGDMPNMSMTYDQAVALTENTFEKEGFTFAGWTTEANSSRVVYADKALVKNLTSEDDATVKLYAVWTTNTVDYEIIKGDEQTVEQGKEAEFSSNAEFSKFVGVMLNGELLDPSNYEVREGSTIVTLKADFVKTLSVGEHKLTIVSEDGDADATFTVKATETVVPGEQGKPGETDKTDQNAGSKTETEKGDASTPKTGDESNMAVYMLAMLLALAVGARAVVRKTN